MTEADQAAGPAGAPDWGARDWGVPRTKTV